ncbi:unnamed protein product [Mytilus coruscus]|uniref:Uncharacterized protein n=1 Tax=Mytilus coruscus TaxID=42192 RepID=A0A6J8CDT4_MYTCO|nr:unnamed protein product [Mytilus coruscus]
MDDCEVIKPNEIKKKISNRKYEVKDAITKEALNLVGVMEEQELLTRKHTLDEVLETQDPASVFSTVEKINSDIPRKSALEIKPPEMIFIEPTEFFYERSLGIDESIKYSGYAKILDITNYNGDILLSDDKFQIRQIKRNGQFENLSPSITNDNLQFNGIHATDNNEIILGFTNSTRSSAGIIELTDMKFNMSYTQDISIMRRVEGSSKALFTLPKKDN